MVEQVTIMVPIIIAVVEFLKKIIGEWLSGTKTIIASFLVGAVVGLFRASVIGSVPQGVLLGLYAAGIAAGLWSAGARIVSKAA